VPRVDLTHHLYSYFPALEGRTLDVAGTTVAAVVAAVEAVAPGFRGYVCDEHGRLRQHVNIFVGDERVTDRHGLTDPVAPDARVLIVQALSGG
jgi:sulfur-carrier protein